MTYPQIDRESQSFSVRFTAEAGDVGGKPIEMVLDFDQFGEVIGIEILDLMFNAGKGCLLGIAQCVPTEGDGVRYSYDEDSDSFYLRVTAGNSLDQKTVDGQLSLDAEGRITAMRAKWRDT
jgi:uncharacterized protein YuzE